MPKDEMPTRLKEEAEKKKTILPVEISTIVDPYTPEEKEALVTRRILEILVPKFMVIVVTKSDLVLRDIDILSRGTCIVEISVTTSDPQLEGMLEPSAPSFERRIRAIGKLTEKGVRVSPRLDPLIPYLNDKPREIQQIVQSMSDAGAKHVTSSTMKADRIILAQLEKAFPEMYGRISRLYLNKGERHGREYFLDSHTRNDLMKRVYRACRKYNMSFATCREGFGLLDTGTCDGFHLLGAGKELPEGDRRSLTH